MIEMDDKALSWLRQNNQKQLHESLLVDPPSVYFPQVYILIDKRKHAFVQMNPEPKKTPLNVFTDWVESFVPHRKKTLRRPKNLTGGKQAKRPVKVISKTNIVRRKVSSQAKKSLKDEIDDAFKKLFLH